MIEILAALSASAAAGMRIALPLLVIGLLQGESLWYGVPILSRVYPTVVLSVLTSCTLVELIASKQLVGQRLLQVFYLLLSPIVGAILAVSVADIAAPKVLIGLIGGLFALVLQLFQAGWLYRWHNLPSCLPFVQDGLCILLVYLAIEIPQAGGILALFLLALAVYSFRELRRWYFRQYHSENDE